MLKHIWLVAAAIHDVTVTQVVEDGLRKRGTIVSPATGNIRLVPLVGK